MTLEKEMENKYYTPEIEEFHEGFSHEYKGPLDTKWHKEDFKLRGHNPNFSWFLTDGHLRVKHLGREDIESLGFENTDEGIADATYVMKINNWRQVNINRYLGEDSDRLHLELHKDNKVHIHNGGSYEQYDGFMLTIKNKSELKRLLKQLGI